MIKSAVSLAAMLLAVGLGLSFSCGNLSDVKLDIRVDGQPLDWADRQTICPACGVQAPNTQGYEYQCPKCGLQYEARYDAAMGKILFSF